MAKFRQTQLNQTIESWRGILQELDWEEFAAMADTVEVGNEGVVRSIGGMGIAGETLAIVDMRDVAITEPHFHEGGSKLCIPLEGSGVLQIGHESINLRGDDDVSQAVIIPPRTAHFVHRIDGLVVASIGLPASSPNIQVNYPIRNIDGVEFDLAEYNRAAQELIFQG